MEQIERLPYFNKVTLGVALGKSGQNLDYWIKTRLKSGEIIALKKGLFVSKNYLLINSGNNDFYRYMANIIRFPSYLSLEYVLSINNLIPEAIYTYTSITTKTSRNYANKIGNFSYRNIKKELFTGFKEIEIFDKKVYIATKAKALFDYLYLKTYRNRTMLKYDIEEGLRIDWDEFNRNERQEFIDYVKLSKSTKMKRALKYLKW
ncbi:MAG: hypothetical protein AAB778_02805 [Patescibacteria group bacterium]